MWRGSSYERMDCCRELLAVFVSAVRVLLLGLVFVAFVAAPAWATDPASLFDAPGQVSVHAIASQRHYEPGPGDSGASCNRYGDPGADQGDRHDIHYSYLLWSFVDVRAGGHVRTLLAPGQVVRACDVDPITMSSWDSQGNVNGQVSARHVRALAGTWPLCGWMVWPHGQFGARR